MPTGAIAQTYPSRPITLIVPFPPGGLADIVARPVAEALSRELGQPVVIENRAGAGGGIGMGVAAKARADGHTLLMALSSLTVIPEADALVGRAPLFALQDLRPIARFTADPTVLAVRADAPWKSAREFIEEARKRPGALTYGSSGNYGTMHVPMEMLAQTAGVQMTHVPFTGAGPAVVALLGGQIDAVSSGPATVLQHIRAGKLRALAVAAERRSSFLPEVPTLADTLPGFNASVWFGIVAPPKTPAALAEQISRAVAEALKLADVSKQLVDMSMEAVGGTPAEMAQYLREESRRWGAVIRQSGARAD